MTGNRQQGRARMKKVYEKPVLARREKLSAVTSAVPVSQQRG